MKRLGLYLHIPFCLQKCNYCDFCSAPASAQARAKYADALCAHLRALAPKAKEYAVDTVYLGGGTPTLLTADEFSQILDTVRAHFHVLPDAEITSECNPVTGAEPLFYGMREAGINRLSIGLQSVHEQELKLLGRLHSFADFESTFAAARRAGFDNISADLMFGIPAQTVKSFRQTLEALCDLSPEHISAYGLRIEDGTAFGRMRDTLPLPSEDDEAEMAELVANLLPAHGYNRYEISNYAKPGYESRHNLRYWLGEEYLGVGPAAHSFFGGVRFETPADTKAYLNTVETSNFNALFQSHHKVEGTEARDEYVMLRMRLADGVDKADFAHRFGSEFEDCYGSLAPLVQGGFLKNSDTCVAFTARGMQLSNTILSEWLDFGGNE